MAHRSTSPAPRPEKTPGIRRTAHGWQAYVYIKGAFRSKHFPPGTPLDTLKSWRLDAKARGQLKLPEPTKADPADSFAEDCRRYLAAVAGMPTISDRTYRIHQWRDALGPWRKRSEFTSVEMRTQLEQWKLEGLSNGSLNQRRTALMNLYTVLDGKGRGIANPVRDVPRYRETPEPWRLPSLEDAEKAIAAVTAPKGRKKTRARLSVLLWTGWPAATLMRLERKDVDWKRGIVLVRGRLKGAGTRDRLLPLLPQAVTALRAFRQANAWGEFSTSAMHSSLARACKRVKLTPFRPYALRHLMLSLIARATRDDRVVAELAMHSDLRQTRRYTESTVDPRLTAGLALVTETLKKPQ